MRKKQLQEADLSEIIYTIAMTAPDSLKRELPEKYFNAIRTEKSAKRFAIQSSFDQKREFLGYLGYRQTVVICNVDNLWGMEINKTMKPLESQRAKYIQDLFDGGMYVTSDKELVSFLEHYAQFTNSPAYTLQMELLRVKKGKMDWSAKFKNKDLEEFKGEEKKWDDIVWFIIMCADAFGSGESAAELLILMYLFVNRNKYLSHEEIENRLYPGLKKLVISNGVKNLLANYAIRKSYNTTNREYTITTRGILKIFKFRERFINSFNFAS